MPAGHGRPIFNGNRENMYKINQPITYAPEPQKQQPTGFNSELRTTLRDITTTFTNPTESKLVNTIAESKPIQSIEHTIDDGVGDIKSFFKTIATDFNKFEQFGETVLTDVKDIAINTFDIVSGTFKFVENNYKIILVVGGVVGASYLYNIVDESLTRLQKRL